MNDQPRDIALWRHYEAAMDAAASLLALSRCRVTDREPLFALTKRQELQLIDLLHEFAYNARRAIQLADEHNQGTRDRAAFVTVAPYGTKTIQLELDSDERPLTDQSLWWVLGRIIHARELRVHHLEEPEVGTQWMAAPHITEYRTSVAFAVRSDYDGPDERHFVQTDQLLAAFLALRDQFAGAFQAIGLPADPHSLYL